MLKNCGILIARGGPPNGRRSEPRSSLRLMLCGNGRRTLLSRPPVGLGPLGRVLEVFEPGLGAGPGPAPGRARRKPRTDEPSKGPRQ